MQPAESLTVHVASGPLELPLDRSHVAIVGIGAGIVTLFLRPTDDLRAPRFEVDLTGAFTVADTPIEAPAAIAPMLHGLIHAGIVSSRTTPDDSLAIELMSGDVVTAASGLWSVEASDGRRWAPQPGGGIAVWSTDAIDDDPPDARLPALSIGAEDDVELDEEPIETPVEIGPGLDLPGVGFHLVGLDVQIDGRLSLTLRPEGARSVSEAVTAFDGPDVMEAFQFFATVNVGPGTVPPDPEVVDAMHAAIERSDFGLGEDVWIALGSVEPSGPKAAGATLGAMGSPVERVRVSPDGRIDVGLEGGPRLTSPDWWVQTSTAERWVGSDGRVTHRRFSDNGPRLAAADTAALAKAWLDHDRTGRNTRFWAWERVDDVIRHQPMTGWLLVSRLIEGAVDEAQLMSVAAGPFEDLLAKHSSVLIDRVEVAARSDPKTMLALAGVWKNSIDDGDWDRIQNLLGRTDG
jgi:hypothetical protein